MAIISFDKDAVIDYVPEYGGNRDSNDPCVVRIKYVSYGRVQFYSRAIAGKIKGNNNAEQIAKVSQGIQKKQFIENVEAITGYSVNGKEVTGAEEFYETADTALITEILQAMESSQKLSEGQLKNFERVSDGIT